MHSTPKLATFASVTTLDAGAITFAKLVAMLKAGKPRAAIKEQLPLFVCGELDGSRTPKGHQRHNAGVKTIVAALGDYDGEQISIDDAAKLLDGKLEAVLYTSPSHTPERPRWRVIAPLAKLVHRTGDVVLSERYRGLVGHLDAMLGSVLHRESYTLSQSFYFGCVDPAVYRVLFTKGPRLDPDGKLIVPIKQARAGTGGGDTTDATEEELKLLLTTGKNLHYGGLQLTARLIGKGHDPELALQYVIALAGQSDRDPTRMEIFEAEMRRAVEGAVAKGWAMPKSEVPDVLKRITEDKPALPEPPPDPDELIDITTGGELRQAEYQPPEYLLDGAVPLTPGAWLLAGKPKQGKTWLAMNLMCAAIGVEPYCDTRRTKPMSALYVALDDSSKARFQRRLKEMDPGGKLVDFMLVTKLGGKEHSSLDLLGAVLKQNPAMRFVVIDTLSAFRKAQRTDSPYQQEYDELVAINRWAHERGIVVLVVHHLRKGQIDAENPFESISGTLGLQGGVDGLIVLHRKDLADDTDDALDQKLAAIWGKGRDVEEWGFGAKLANGRWEKIGRVSDVFHAATKREILTVLEGERERWWTSKEIHGAGSFDCKWQSVQRACIRMAKAGLIDSQRGALPGKSGGGGGFRAKRG